LAAKFGLGGATKSGPQTTFGPGPKFLLQDQLYAKKAVNGPQTTLQGKEGCLIIVMDDWGQFHTNATLLKFTKHYHGLFRVIQGHEKPSGKSRPGYLFCSAVVSR